MKKIAKFGILGLVLVYLVGSVFAFGGQFQNTAAREALENNYYDAWKAVIDGLTEERFNELQEKHSQMMERKVEMDLICETGEIPEDFEGPKRFEQNFDSICQLREAKQSGMEPEELKELAEELGLKRPMHRREFR